mmetsp:Transcript_6516/g.15984  ORF Transcript_6516/g.15984 Transcript_6516/m.15984 type:complete len:216 (-) Transcript_6516:788-1435(-)
MCHADREKLNMERGFLQSKVVGSFHHLHQCSAAVLGATRTYCTRVRCGKLDGNVFEHADELSNWTPVFFENHLESLLQRIAVELPQAIQAKRLPYSSSDLFCPRLDTLRWDCLHNSENSRGGVRQVHMSRAHKLEETVDKQLRFRECVGVSFDFLTLLQCLKAFSGQGNCSIQDHRWREEIKLLNGFLFLRFAPGEECQQVHAFGERLKSSYVAA